MVNHRRLLHRHPEVGIELPQTHEYIARQLRALGLEPEQRASAGVSVRIPGRDSESPPLVFRADMDALPVAEDTELEFSSEHPGAMHACGHDLHMAALLGVAEHCVSHTPLRSLILAFQPGEESDRGALATLTHQNLQVPNAQTFAIHVNAVLPVGTIHYSRGTFMAFGDWFEVSFTGPGGHASAPERVGNPIGAGAQFQQELVSVAKRLSRPRARVVATVTEFLSGNTVNVIPTDARLRGTVRTVDSTAREQLHRAMHQTVLDIAQSHNLTGELVIHEGYPAVVCDSAFVEQALSSFQNAGIGGFVEMEHPSMVIEDYSYFLQRWPGAMFYVGAAVGEDPAFNHSANAMFDEEAMVIASELFITLANTPAPSA